jgi:hypothetical protein
VLPSLTASDLPPSALVGGLAVTTRLAMAHRSTIDVDLVAAMAEPSTVSLLVAQGASPQVGKPHRLLYEGVVVDIIDVEEHADFSGLPLDHELFVRSHAMALRTSERVDLEVDGPEGRRNGTLPIATPTSLVAMKAAAMSGPYRENAKRPPDAYDLLRLLQRFPAEAADNMRKYEPQLGRLVADTVHRFFVDEPTRVVRWLRQGEENMRRVDRDEVVEAGQRYLYLWAEGH